MKMFSIKNLFKIWILIASVFENKNRLVNGLPTLENNSIISLNNDWPEINNTTTPYFQLREINQTKGIIPKKIDSFTIEQLQTLTQEQIKKLTQKQLQEEVSRKKLDFPVKKINSTTDLNTFKTTTDKSLYESKFSNESFSNFFQYNQTLFNQNLSTWG